MNTVYEISYNALHCSDWPIFAARHVGTVSFVSFFIQEDFRIALRKGLSLLQNIRQAESKPTADMLSPTRLHNVTTVER